LAAKANTGKNDGSDNKENIVKQFVHMVFLKCSYVNMTLVADGEPKERHIPQLFVDEGLAKMMDTCKYLGTLSDWLSSQMENDPCVIAPLSKSKHYEPIHTAVMDMVSNSTSIFERPHSVVHECVNELFQMTINRITKDYDLPGFMPSCLGHWFLPLDASLLVMAVKVESTPGDSFVNKVHSVTKGDANFVVQLITDHGFACTAQPGTLVYLPPGYVYWLVALKPGAFLRWASLSAVPNSDMSTIKTILANLTLLHASYPTLFDSNKDWITYLETMLQ
jgi:hypothetical protein